MMPSSHLCDATKNKAILIFLTGKSIDVGSVLHASISYSISGVSMELYFPSLITILCGRARVSWGQNEEVI